MKTRRCFRNLLACLLALTVMLLPGLSAFAAKETTTVNVLADTADMTVTVEGIEVENQNGAIIRGLGEYTAEATVNGEVTAKGTMNNGIGGVVVRGEENGVSKGTVHGGVEVTNDSTFAGNQVYGGRSDAYNQAETGLTVDGNIRVHSEIGSAGGLFVTGRETGNGTAHVSGNVTAEGKQRTEAAESTAWADARASLTVDGNILAVSESGKAVAVSVQGLNSGDASAHLGGDVTAEGQGGVNGIYVRSENNGTGENPTATVTVDGTISATGVYGGTTNANYGLYNIASGGEATSTIEVGENVEAHVHGPGIATGIYSSARDGQASITVKGDVIAESKADSSIATASGMATGLELWSQADGQNTVSIGGDLAASAEGNEARGLHVIAGTESATEVTVGGDITAAVSGEGYGAATGILAEIYVGSETTVKAENITVSNESKGSSRAIDVRGRSGDLIVDVSGDVTATGSGTGIYLQDMYGGGDSKVKINVGGDITADQQGVHTLVVGPSDSNETAPAFAADITVGGSVTVEGKDNGIGVSAQGIGGTTTVDIAGDVIAKSDVYTQGIQQEATDGGSVDVTVGGDLSVTGLVATGATVLSQEEGSSSALTVDGNAAVTGVEADEEHTQGSRAKGMIVEGVNDGAANATVNGDMNATSAGWTTGVEVDAYHGGSATMNLNGDLTAEADGEAVKPGDFIQAEALSIVNGEGKVNVTVNGDIHTAADTATGMRVYNILYEETEETGGPDELDPEPESPNGALLGATEDVTTGQENTEETTAGTEETAKETETGENGHTVVTVNGSITAEGTESIGIVVLSEKEKESVPGGNGALGAAAEAGQAETDAPAEDADAAEQNAVAKITVNGDVTAGQTGLQVTQNNLAPLTTDVLINGTLNGGRRGINVRGDGGDLTVKVTGDVTARDSGTGIFIQELYGGDASVDITVGGNVIADQQGIYSQISLPVLVDQEVPEVSVDIAVGGDVKVEANTYGRGVNIRSGGGTTAVDIAGDVTGTSKGYIQGVLLDALSGGSVVGSVGGDVSVTGIQANGAVVQADEEGSNADLTVGGDLTVTGIQATAEDVLGSRAQGLTVESENDAEATVTLNGDLNATSAGWTTGMDVEAYQGGSSTVTLNGDLTAVADGEITQEGGFIQAEALSMINGEGEIDITVNGDIETSGDTATGLRVYNINYEGTDGTGETAATVNGDITAEGEESIGLVLLSTEETYEEPQSNGALRGTAEAGPENTGATAAAAAAKKRHAVAKIVINGDVTAGKTGMLLNLEEEAPLDADVLIDGTLTGGQHAIVLAQETSTENVTVTVWKIVPDADGAVVSRMEGEGDEVTYTEDEAAEQEIQYIIRAVQPAAGGSFTLDGTTEYEGYDVANEGDLVYLRIEVEDGYDVVGAYNGTEVLTSLDQDENGDYYLAVPRGGGVTLSLRLRKHLGYEVYYVGDQDAAPAVTVTTVSAPPAETGNSASYVQAQVTIDPNGGAVGDKTEAWTVSTFEGKWLTLPATPVKEGATFLGWYGTAYSREDARWTAPEAGSPELKKAFDQVRIDGDIWYTAIWAEAGE